MTPKLTPRVSSALFTVRRGRRGDSDAVLSIFFEALKEHGFLTTRANVNPEIARFGSGADPTQDDYVAMAGHDICGFLIQLEGSDGCGMLAKVFVARPHRGRGVGTRLIERCIARAKQRGYQRLVLESHVRFAAARRYYERNGWVPDRDPATATSEYPTYSLELVGALGASAACAATASRAR